MNRGAIIDIGSNSVRLIIYHINEHSNFEVIDEAKETIRLGSYLTKNNYLIDDGIEIAINVLKRFNKEDNKIVYGSIKINLDEKTVYVNEESVEFTALEFKILVLMFTNIGKVITREQILEKIWDVAGNFVNDNTLTVYIKRIRTKLGKMDCIKTIKGIGYQVQGGQK